MKKVKNKKQTGRVVQRSKKNKKSNSSKKINEMLRLGDDDGYTSHESESIYDGMTGKTQTHTKRSTTFCLITNRKKGRKIILISGTK